MRVIRVALKYFAFGLAAGLLLAPRAGSETRTMLIGRVTNLLQEVLGASEQPEAHRSM
jgi:hypothetical protein